MHLVLFLVVLIISVVSGQTEEYDSTTPSSLSCKRTMWFKSGAFGVCCQRVKYPLIANQKFLNSCNVEPTDENLSFHDSLWLVYGCHVKNWINGTDLTRESFMTWISKLEVSDQTQLWENLEKENDNDYPGGEMGISKRIKSYFFQYYDAVGKICSLDSQVRGKMVDTLTFQLWQNCSSGLLPKFSYLYVSTIIGNEQYKQCRNEFLSRFGNHTFGSFHREIFGICSYLNGKQGVIHELEKDQSGIEILTSILPRFWSKSVKKRALEICVQSLGRYLFGVNGTDVTVLVPQLIEKIAAKLENRRNVTNVSPILAKAALGAYFGDDLKFLPHAMCKPE